MTSTGDALGKGVSGIYPTAGEAKSSAQPLRAEFSSVFPLLQVLSPLRVPIVSRRGQQRQARRRKKDCDVNGVIDALNWMACPGRHRSLVSDQEVFVL